MTLAAASLETSSSSLVEDRLFPCSRARVLFADYEAIRQDFPHVTAGKRGHDKQSIDQWLLSRCAVISEQQLVPNQVNTSIDTIGPPIRGYRPINYGRACIIPTTPECDRSIAALPELEEFPNQFVDVKGIGVGPNSTPTRGSHSDGLFMLGRVIAAHMNYRLLSKVLEHAGIGIGVVKEYAVIDMGFDLIGSTGETTPAGAIVRRFHPRPFSPLPVLGSEEHRTILKVELTLRHYGVTSSSRASSLRIHHHNGHEVLAIGGTALFSVGPEAVSEFRRMTGIPPEVREIDGINIQLAYASVRNGTANLLIDLGHYKVRDYFAAPLFTFVRNVPFYFGGILLPTSTDFVQPIATLAIPAIKWGGVGCDSSELYAPNWDGEKWTSAHQLGFRLAVQFRHAHLSGDEVHAALNAFVQDSVAHL